MTLRVPDTSGVSNRKWGGVKGDNKGRENVLMMATIGKSFERACEDERGRSGRDDKDGVLGEWMSRVKMHYDNVVLHSRHFAS
jgi:hypothetical protein